jgi:hypothetical protein
VTGRTSGPGGDRCRWHEDPNGRCADPVAFPADTIAPPFWLRHIGRLEPWIRSRAAARSSDASGWIAWAARRAAETEDDLKALGLTRPTRAGDGRPLRHAAPGRR